MKIKVPSGALEANLTDREMIFVNLILQLLLDGDFPANKVQVDTEFYFYLDDIRKITGRNHADINGPGFAELRKVLVFKSSIKDKFAVTLRSPKMNRRGLHNGSINMADYILKDQTAINLYFYLIGITSVKGIVQEFKSLSSMPNNSKINRNRLVTVRVQ